MSAPNLLPGMRPLSPASDYSFEYVQRDRAQWAAEVERLRAEVQRLTAERDEAEARHENELRTRLDHVGAMDDENTKIILENDALKAQVLDGHGCPPEHKDPNDDYVDGYYVVCAKCFDALAAEGESRDHAE